MLPCHYPPMTGREALQVVFGDRHAEHSVQSCNCGAAPIDIQCSCGFGIGVDQEFAHERGTRLRDLREALKSAPRGRAA